MTGATVVPFLAILTLGAVVVFALVSQQATIKRMNDPKAPKSKLAADEPTPVTGNTPDTASGSGGGGAARDAA